ncbi:MAG: hypothetical protein NTY62_07630 [Euryarchaeota archaeon]|nr:hypothetical protein [Euryarchaeota archaeon]
MKLIDMKTKCRMCGKVLIADDKDDDFVSFYCMKCGVYTTRPVEEFKDEPKPEPPAPAKPEEKKV